MAFADTYRGKRVLLTGHTGFKGAWLAEWLLSLGAEVTGLALPPPTEPAIFDQLALAGRLHHRIGDIRELATVRAAVEATRPDFVFHLAAQALVRLSYEQPVETYATNVLGTVHVLEAVRLARRPCTVVAITTDKSYENKEWVHSYREEDPMGGHDPYSSSKGMAELAIAAYRRSYFSTADSPVRLASARAGNVIGGGDWALDRIVPDCIRSSAPSRFPCATKSPPARGNTCSSRSAVISSSALRSIARRSTPIAPLSRRSPPVLISAPRSPPTAPSPILCRKC
jgi:CDP-glucose 4,6-dehydratase